MKRVEIIVKGEVQRVGYRNRVQRIARKLNLLGYVENLKPHDVRIVVEGKREVIEKFIQKIKIKKFPIEVEEIKVDWKESTGEFDTFKIKRGNWKEELGSRMDLAGKLLYKGVEQGDKNIELGEENIKIGRRNVELSEKNIELSKQMLGKQDQMLGKQDQMLGKQDEMLGKQDQMLGKQDKTISILERNTKETQELRKDMLKRFDSLERKYGQIAENMERILREMKEERKESREFMERMIKLLTDKLT